MGLASHIMAGTSNGHGISDDDRGSDDEAFVSFPEHGCREDVLLLKNCNRRSILNDELVFIEPSTSNPTVEHLEPFTGMAFSSLEEARDFYYEYAKQTGFSIRSNRVRHSVKNMAIIGRDFVCSREGFRATKHTRRNDRVLPPKPITRQGCKAMIRLAAREKGKWIVTKFEREHNHKLMANCRWPGDLPIVNIVSEEEKDKKIQDLRLELQREREQSETLQKQICMIMKDLEEHADFMGIKVKDIVNRMRKIELDDQ